MNKGNFVFLHGLVRSVLKVFAELFLKKRLAEGTDKSKFERKSPDGVGGF